MQAALRSVLGPARAGLGLSDAVRRSQGRTLDLLGLGPHPAPSTVRLATPAFRLRSYEPAARPAPPLLVVPAPIKRAYIWDLAPGASPVRLLAEAGFAVSLLEWLDPDPSESDAGIDTFVDRIGAAVDAVRAEGGDTPVLVGHSLGGTLASLFAARYPDRAAGLVLVEAPLHFGPDAGAFAPLVATSPHLRWLESGLGLVPGTFLDLVTTAAAPREFVAERHVDFWTSLAGGALRLHLQVHRWSLDELALPGRLVVEIVEDLYRNDRFRRGDLLLAGSRVGPDTLTVPMLNVVDPHDLAIPAGSILPFHHAAASPRKRLLSYRGEPGVALRHVGVLIGPRALATVWPEIVAWLRELG